MTAIGIDSDRGPWNMVRGGDNTVTWQHNDCQLL